MQSEKPACPECGSVDWTWIGPGARKSPALDSGQLWQENGNVYRCRSGHREWFAGEALKTAEVPA